MTGTADLKNNKISLWTNITKHQQIWKIDEIYSFLGKWEMKKLARDKKKTQTDQWWVNKLKS